MAGHVCQIHTHVWQSTLGRAKMWKDYWKAHMRFLKERRERNGTCPSPADRETGRKCFIFNKTSQAPLKPGSGLFLVMPLVALQWEWLQGWLAPHHRYRGDHKGPLGKVNDRSCPCKGSRGGRDPVLSPDPGLCLHVLMGCNKWTEPRGHGAHAYTRNDFKMCGCILKKNRPWHIIRYQTAVIDTETGCALHWVVMNLPGWPQSLHFWAPTTHDLTLCQLLQERWITDEVLMTHFITCLPSAISGPPLIYQKDVFWSYCQLEQPLVWSGYKVTHTWGNLASGSGTKVLQEEKEKKKIRVF